MKYNRLGFSRIFALVGRACVVILLLVNIILCLRILKELEMKNTKNLCAVFTTFLLLCSVSALAVETLTSKTDTPRERTLILEKTSSDDSQPELGFKVPSDDPQPKLGFKVTSAVSINTMVQDIRDKLENNTTGFAFVINRRGEEVAAGAWGAARTNINSYSSMTVDTRMNVASVSKNISAIALLQLLEEKAISIDTPIGHWLPPSWIRGNGFTPPAAVGAKIISGIYTPTEYLTFRHLLQHKTGLGQLFQLLTVGEKANWGNDWDGLQYVVSLDSDPGAVKSYKNANFALIRILVAYIIAEGTGIDISKDNYTAIFMSHVNSVLFNPADVFQVVCYVQDQFNHARFYNFYHPDISGKLSETQGDSCGGHSNFHLSARDLAKIASASRYNNAILSDEQRALMDDNKLGWMSKSGGIYYHGGDLYYSLNHVYDGPTFAIAPNVKHNKELHTCIMKMPFGYEASLLINSSLKSKISACGLLKSAYLAASNN